MSESSFNIPRHWWGKIIGGVLGLFKGGISGALIGALLGHMVDRFLAGIVGVRSTQKSFFDALFATLGHLSKADGIVTQTEIHMVETLMQRMQITGDERQRAIRLFNQGKQPDFDLDKTLHDFARHSMVRQDLFSAMLNARGAGAGAGGYRAPGGDRRAPGKQMGSMAQAYAHLGLEASASDAEVKKAYRKLVSQYHPDKLVSHGLPEEMMDIAKSRVREINAAYDQIKQSRGFK
jgi:DnaJ like chaperone protein